MFSSVAMLLLVINFVSSGVAASVLIGFGCGSVAVVVLSIFSRSAFAISSEYIRVMMSSSEGSLYLSSGIHLSISKGAEKECKQKM